MTSASSRAVTAPRPPELPPPRRVPVVATVAPVVVSLVLFAVTRSPFTLVFAVLGPVVAVASTVDAALQRRRTCRREAVRFAADVARVRAEIAAAHRDEASAGVPRLAELLAQPSAVLQRWRTGGEVVLRVGEGVRPSTLRYEPAGAFAAPPTASVAAELAELQRTAERLEDASITIGPTTGIGIAGSGPLGAAAFRSLVLHLAASLSPAAWTLEIPAGAEHWLADLPHSARTNDRADDIRFVALDHRLRLVRAATVDELPRELDDVLRLLPGGSGRAADTVFRPELMSREQATAAAGALAEIAARSGTRPTAGMGLPETVALSRLDQSTASSTLAAAVGVGTDGTMLLDLVTQGPHAIVGGTTGSGKSELLLSWVLGMAAERPPDRVSFLFVDFKGGASFGSLVELPHSVGVITDLDTEQALRALASLAAELRHRERVLAGIGLRGIDDAERAPFARLVIVVDEYAALVESFPALHPVFTDIAARGRSLGVHLVLCTQRPAGVVRDGILANCALRISLRVSSAADSAAVLGSDAAATPQARPLGRAFVSVGGAIPTGFQVALSDRADVDRVIARWAGSDRPRVPWLPPLPSRVALQSLGALSVEGGIAFALADVPAHQVQRPAVYRPQDHGSLLIVGASGSGKTGALAALAAASSTVEVTSVPTALPELWDFVTAALSGDEPERGGRARVVLLDDLDSALSRCPEVYQPSLVDLLGRLLRDGPATGTWCVLTAQRVGGALHGLAALCGSQLVLRMPNRAEHALVGAEGVDFVRDLPPGGGFWRGDRVQVALAEPPRAEPRRPRARGIDLQKARVVVVSSHPEKFAVVLRQKAPERRIVPLAPAGFGDRPDSLEVSVGDARVILVGDPDLWQSQWSLFGTLQRGCDVLFDGCSLAEVRALTRSRDLPPPFAAGVRSLWIRTVDGHFARATLESSGS